MGGFSRPCSMTSSNASAFRIASSGSNRVKPTLSPSIQGEGTWRARQVDRHPTVL